MKQQLSDQIDRFIATQLPNMDENDTSLLVRIVAGTMGTGDKDIVQATVNTVTQREEIWKLERAGLVVHQPSSHERGEWRTYNPTPKGFRVMAMLCVIAAEDVEHDILS